MGEGRSGILVGSSMKTYEVTLKFSKPPWYTGLAIAVNKAQAVSFIASQARQHGFFGYYKVEVKEV